MITEIKGCDLPLEELVMYKCLECGNIFDYGEEKSWIEPHGEKLKGCPICGSAYEITVSCRKCSSDHLQDELYSGICEDCLDDEVTYDNFLEYLTDKDILADFLFDKFWECEVPKTVSDKLKRDLRLFYLRQKADDLLTGRHCFLDICTKYIMEDDGEFGKHDYAEWLNEREVK